LKEGGKKIMYRTVVVIMVILFVAVITAQFTKPVGYQQAISEINEIGSFAHTKAMKAPWITNDFYELKNNMINTTVKGEVDKVVDNEDMRYEDVYIIIGGYIYHVVSDRIDLHVHRYKKGDIVDVYILLKYEPMSINRGKTIFSVEELMILHKKGVVS
jgi:hypothetical protein